MAGRGCEEGTVCEQTLSELLIVRPNVCESMPVPNSFRFSSSVPSWNDVVSSPVLVGRLKTELRIARVAQALLTAGRETHNRIWISLEL